MSGRSRQTDRGIVIPRIFFLSFILAAPARCDAPDAAANVKHARQSGRELIRTGRFDRALLYLRSATRESPDDGELQRLLAAAALDQAIQLDNEGENAAMRLAMAGEMRSLVFGYPFIERAVQCLGSSLDSPTRNPRLALLKSRLGALLMQSDLPEDWVLGAKLRREGLEALAKNDALAPDVAASARVDLQQVRAEIAARPLPLQFSLLWQGRLQFVPVTDEDGTITGPCLIIFRDGTVVQGI